MADINKNPIQVDEVSSSNEVSSQGRKGTPTKKPAKIRTKQPKSSKKIKFITTEIRCQEKSKGGLCYEVILAEPSVAVAVPKLPVTPAKITSAEEIEEKLRAAEERRLQMEAKKISEWSAKQAKIEEATRKKEIINNEFAAQAREALEAKMEQYDQKREALITDMREKLKIHAQEIEKTRHSLENKKDEERRAIEEKLKAAESMRDENIKKMLERLKEHERRAEVVRQNKAALNNSNPVMD